MPATIVEIETPTGDPHTTGLVREPNKNVPPGDQATNSSAGTLSKTYYLDNFNFVMNFVSRHYEALLQHEERHFLQIYNALPADAQQLFVRLVQRTSAYLRLSKINYPEINQEASLNKLSNAGLIDLDSNSLEECLPLFTQRELCNALGSNSSTPPFADSTSWTTPDLFGDSAIAKLLSNDRVIKVNFKQTIEIFRLLFFGNLHQDFSSFVMRDLGLQRFEPYPVEQHSLLFNTREQILAHLYCHKGMEQFDTACEQGVDALLELHNELPQRIENDKTLCRRLDRLHNKIARQLERESELHLAAEIYSDSANPPAKERLARIHATNGNTAKALDICKKIVQTPQDSDELDFAYTFGARLAKKHSLPFPVENRYGPPQTQLTLHKSHLSVEFSVATHMAKTGKCYYLENNLVCGVFGLAFWDIIFAPIKGVFFHPFQNKPADFYEPEFTSSRVDLINQRFSDIAIGRLGNIVNTHLYQKRGIQNPIVNWRMCRKHIIDLALKRIPAETWQQLFRQMLSDIRNYRAGQPDLIYFPDAGGYQFIEVKAPGDKLQKNQLRWLKCFDENMIPHIVINVEWSDSIR